MKTETSFRNRWILIPMIVLLAGVAAFVNAQEPALQNQEPGRAQAQAQTQINQLPNLAPLNLSPEQIQKIRMIYAELKDQTQTANQRQRLAQRALTEAIESPTPNEAMIDQRSRELAEAQATTIRLRSLREARILQVMTTEQRIRLREMQQQNQATRRQGNQQVPGNILRQRQQGLQPGLRSNQRKIMRPPRQKP